MIFFCIKECHLLAFNLWVRKAQCPLYFLFFMKSGSIQHIFRLKTANNYKELYQGFCCLTDIVCKAKSLIEMKIHRQCLSFTGINQVDLNHKLSGWWSLMTKVCSFWGPTRMWVTIHQCSTIFELLYHTLICVLPMAMLPKAS